MKIITRGADASKIIVSTATLTRPTGTLTYGNNASISPNPAALTEIPNVLPIGGGDGMLLAVRAFTNKATWATPIRIHLYKNATPTPIADNSPFALLFANRAHRVGYVDISTWNSGGTGSDAAAGFGVFPEGMSTLSIELEAGQTSLWCAVETRATGGAADASQQFWISLKTMTP